MHRKPGVIVFLHGTSSSGKTSIANAIQEQQTSPWMHLSLDHFFEMQPKKYQTFDWPLYTPLCRGLHRSAVLWSDLGLPVLVDTVIESSDLLLDAAQVLQAHCAYFIGISCSLEELERRETLRGDRPIGLAKFQYELVHAHGCYDLTLDSSSSTVHDNASAIIRFLGQCPEPRAFRHLAERAIAA